MNTKLMTAAAAALMISATTAYSGEYNTGLAALEIEDANGNRPLDGYVWYPTHQSDGYSGEHGNPVWQAVQVIKDAPIASGEFPLVVLSHGMFGNARNQAWLADELVQAGYIVAAVNHPGTSTFSRDPDQRRMLWERPRDLSRTIDHLIADADFAVDEDAIYMAGHSLGGFTALLLNGGRYDAAKVDAMCAAERDMICDIFEGWKIAKTPEDAAMMESDWSDDRIVAFASFDLGGTQLFAPDSLGAIETPALVFGAPVDYADINLDQESRALAELLPEASSQYIEPSDLAHMDFLGVCTEKALAILEEEEPEDAFVCFDGTEERVRKHGLIADAVRVFFASHR